MLNPISLEEITLKKSKNERGAAAVEFAIVLPILLLILLSIIDFGRYAYVRISLSSASFEVADAVSRGLFVAADTSATKQSKMLALIGDVAPGIANFAQMQNPAQLTLTPLPEICPNAANQITVTLKTGFNSISPLDSFFSEASAATSMRCLR